jgi:predicted nucleic acid-binding protein
VSGAASHLPGSTELASADWVRFQRPTSESPIESALLGLDAGELQVPQLGLEAPFDFVIIDERLGRRVAKALGLQVIRTIGLLSAAHQADMLDQDAVLNAVVKMKDAGVFISPRVIAWLEDRLG